LRLDHFLLNDTLKDKLLTAQVDKDVRGWEPAATMHRFGSNCWIDRLNNPSRSAAAPDRSSTVVKNPAVFVGGT
jgi:hypothetical protein